MADETKAKDKTDEGKAKEKAADVTAKSSDSSDAAVATTPVNPAVAEPVQPVVTGQAVHIVPVSDAAPEPTRALDETRPGGEILMPIPNGGFRVVDAEGRPVKGRVYDAKSKKVVDEK